SSNGKFAAREPGDDLPVVVERRRGDAVALRRIARKHVPQYFARLLIEGDQSPVEAAEKDLAVTHAESAAEATAADDGFLEIDIGFIRPNEFPRVDIDGEDVVVARDDVDHAFVEEGLRLLRIARSESRAVEADSPDGLDLVDVVAIDLVQRRITLVVDIAAVRDPVLRR